MAILKPLLTSLTLIACFGYLFTYLATAAYLAIGLHTLVGFTYNLYNYYYASAKP